MPRAPAKINLLLGVGRAATRRLPPAGDRLPGGRACTTTSPSRGRRRGHGDHGVACLHRRRPAARAGSQHRRPAAALLAEHHGTTRRCAGARGQGDPGRRRHGRRLGRRGRRPGRARPALRPRQPPTRTCSRWPRSWAVTCRSRSWAARRSARAAASWSPRWPTTGSWWWVVVPSAVGACRRRRSTGTSTSCSPDAPEEPAAARRRSSPPWPRATLERWPRPCTTTSSTPRSTCAPTWRRLIVDGRDAGALRGLVSGSGPTCVFLCESRRACARGRRDLSSRFRQRARSASYWSPTARSPAHTW